MDKKHLSVVWRKLGTDAFGFVPLNLLVLVLLFGLRLLIHWLKPWRRPAAVTAQAKVPRPLKPKTGDACPMCQAAPKSGVNEGGPGGMPRQWKEGRSPRGRKKGFATQGYAGDNRACAYYGITDEMIHALVAYGSHGKCNACEQAGPPFKDHTVLFQELVDWGVARHIPGTFAFDCHFTHADNLNHLQGKQRADVGT